MTFTRRNTLKLFAAGSGLMLAAPASVLAQEKTVVVTEMTMGAEDAPVTMIEYASFTCPHCARFHEEVLGDLKANYIDTGKVKFIYREVYFDRFGLWAGMLARCGGESKYFGIADMLYARQKEWLAGGTDPATTIANMKKLGLVAGLTNDQMESCLQDADMAEALVTEFQKNATADDINATPTFMIDGKQYPNMGYDDMKKVLDERLGL